MAKVAFKPENEGAKVDILLIELRIYSFIVEASQTCQTGLNTAQLKRASCG
jgi:hypothetical protein